MSRGKGVRSCVCAICIIAILSFAFFFLLPKGERNVIAEGEHVGVPHGTVLSQAGGALAQGDYYLDANIEVTDTYIINDTVDLCLNGFKLQYSGARGSIFRITDGGTLNLYDCQGGGSISGGKGDFVESVSNGGAVFIQSGGIFNMYGGVLGNNTATYGGAVCNEGGTFNMYGGGIANNSATGDGGGVNISADAKFNVYGGEITGNTSATMGGGVYVCHYGSATDNAVFAVSGGKITGNTAATGGGVYIAEDGCEMRLGGIVDITGNTVIDGSHSNVHLGGPVKINIEGRLSDGNKKAAIGMTLATDYSGGASFTVGYATYNTGVDPYEYFTSDDSRFFCVLNAGEVGRTSRQDIPLDATMQWSVNNSYNLGNGTIWRYMSAVGGEVYYGSEHTGEDLTLLGTKEVVSSIARYNSGNKLTLTVSGAHNGYSVVYANNEGTLSGSMVTTATLTAEPKYRFVLGSGDFGIDAQNGIVVTLEDSGTIARITKVWYIIASDNELLDEGKSLGSGTATAFGIPSWTFGEAAEIGKPRLKHGGVDDNAAIAFKLKRGDKYIDGEFGIDKYDYYINGTMPSGNYVLSVEVGDVHVDAENNWWNGDPSDALDCTGFTAEYVFTVSDAHMGFNLQKDDKNGYAAYDWLLDETNKSEFFAGFYKKISDDGVVELTDIPQKEGYWGTRSASEFYGGYSVTYNFVRIYDNNYRTEDSAELTNLIGGGVNGTYKVYFRITAPNHAGIAVGGDRYEYFFIVNVYQCVSLPELSGKLVYTGARNVPTIPSNTVYEVVYDENDEYITGGEHSLSLRLLDSVHYHWEDGVETSGENNETAELAFTVDQATNTWLRTPNIIGWEYGDYSPQNNYIVAIPTFRDDGKKVKLSVASDEDGNSPVSGLENFTVDENGYVSDSIKSVLEKLKYGDYWLFAEFEQSVNYTGLSKQGVSFKVAKAVNYWTKPLSVVAWSDGDYNAKKNAITAQSHVGDVVIVIKDSKGKQYYNSATKLNRLKDAPVGQYIMTATVEASDNYSALSDAVAFNVFEAASGMAWWIVLLIVLGVVAVVILVLFILYKKGIFQLVSEKMIGAIRARADSDAVIAMVRAGKAASEAQRAEEEKQKQAAAAAEAEAAENAASDEEESQPEVEDENEETKPYEPEEGDTEVPSSGGFKKAFAVSSEGTVTYGKTVLSKLICSSDAVKTRYSELKNYLLAYKKARANMSRARESFYIGRTCYARIAVRGKTLCLYIAADPEKYAGTKYSVESALGVKTYADTPCMMRIRSDRAVRYAKELIDELMGGIGAVKIDRKPENYVELFKSIELFEKKRLLMYDGRKQKNKT